jgi:hypothetical protein
VRGRAFDERDTKDAPLGVVINETMARARERHPHDARRAED